MRVRAAIEGNLNNIVAQELKDATAGAREGMKEGTNLLKTRLRSQIQRAGLGPKLAKTWQGRFYDNDRGLNVAGFVYSKAQRLVGAFSEGTTIRAKSGRLLAIPTEHAPKRGRDRRRRATPDNWNASRFGPLKFIPSAGRRTGLLVVEENRLSKKTGRATGRAKRTKTGRMGRGAATIVMFVLVPQVRLKKRLNIRAAESQVVNLLPRLILRKYKTTPVRKK